MAMNYAYHYAQIELDTGWCYGVQTTTREINTVEEPEFIPIPVYDENYLMKYYINGNWYEDAEGTIPWESALL